MNKELIKNTLEWLFLVPKEELKAKLNILISNVSNFETSVNENYKNINFDVYYNSKILLRYISIFKIF